MMPQGLSAFMQDATIVSSMVPSAVLVLAVGVFVAAGVYLILERSLTRVLLGFVLIGNGVNIMLLLAGGQAGVAPIIGTDNGESMSDPLAQAMMLTSIVITLAMVAFLSAMAYRSWQLYGHDEVQDDIEDARVARHAHRGEAAYTDLDAMDLAWTLDDEAAEVHDDYDIDDGAAAEASPVVAVASPAAPPAARFGASRQGGQQ